jgi:hypothetical protein
MQFETRVSFSAKHIEIHKKLLLCPRWHPVRRSRLRAQVLWHRGAACCKLDKRAQQR